jgi:hypothetical protein
VEGRRGGTWAEVAPDFKWLIISVMKFQLFAGVNINFVVFWDLTPSSSV